MPTVIVHKNEPIEKALRRLKKLMTKEGTIQILKQNRYYEKPSDRKRRQRARNDRTLTKDGG